jgi:hypothetical protein
MPGQRESGGGRLGLVIGALMLVMLLAVADGAPTDEGSATVRRLLEARRDCLTELVADWGPDEDPRVNDAIERLAQELAQEVPART